MARPDDLKRLVDAAHARGLMVLLDVVYNHFGPDGNYLHAYAGAAFFDPARAHAVGRGDRLRRRRSAARCATSSSTTRCTGSRNSTSTACASMPCTRCTTGRALHFVDELAQRVRGRSAQRGRCI